MGTPSTYSMTKYGRPTSVAPPSNTWAMLGCVHQRQGLALRVEPGEDLARVHARLDHLQRDLAANWVVLLGEVDHAHSALAEDPQDSVWADASLVDSGR